jgi:hypothetical protein
MLTLVDLQCPALNALGALGAHSPRVLEAETTVRRRLRGSSSTLQLGTFIRYYDSPAVRWRYGWKVKTPPPANLIKFLVLLSHTVAWTLT